MLKERVYCTKQEQTSNRFARDVAKTCSYGFYFIFSDIKTPICKDVKEYTAYVKNSKRVTLDEK